MQPLILFKHPVLLDIATANTGCLLWISYISLSVIRIMKNPTETGIRAMQASALLERVNFRIHLKGEAAAKCFLFKL